MKRFFLFAAMLFLGLALSAKSYASGFAIGWNMPHVTVKVINNTSDLTPIGPVLDGSSNKTLTARGDIFKRMYGETAFGGNAPASIDFEIYACRSSVRLQDGSDLCGNDSQIMTGVIDITQYNGRRPILIVVTGDRTNGYKYVIQN
jgi:hypothetical protein